jgi:hypothetical protein
MGSSVNLLCEWETGEITWIPLRTKDRRGLRYDDPVTLAIYARENNLIGDPGFSDPYIKKLSRTHKNLVRQANQAKLRSFRTRPIYMYGVRVPRNYDEAVMLDAENGNTLWQDACNLELGQIMEYEAFKDKGINFDPGAGFKKISAHLVFAVKHDGKRKARFVAGGHLTDTPIDPVYSSVISQRGLRILTFLAELQGQECWSTDIGNAYLESYTQEKVYIVAGPEFAPFGLEGHTLVVNKALYGLKSSGKRWHERFSDVLRSMDFFPSKAEPDIWMRRCGDHYEYIGVYVDDLCIVSKSPQAIIDDLTKKHKFKLKGTGPIKFHLGMSFGRDEDGTMYYSPQAYIEKLISDYERIYGRPPRQVVSPLNPGDHPEEDDSELLDDEQTRIYQSLVGAIQWVVQIGRFDVATAIMTLSRFRAMPRQGHLERVKRIYGYLAKMRFAKIRIRTDMPDFSMFPEKKHDWWYTCYGGAKEDIPTDIPEPLGPVVLIWSCYDANLFHDTISGRSVTGILHFLNKTPIDWFSKLQATVETATFGSEFVAARTCADQLVDLRNTLRYLGVPIDGPSYMFGDNESVQNAIGIPTSKLHKQHNALSHHRTREAEGRRHHTDLPHPWENQSRGYRQ